MEVRVKSAENSISRARESCGEDGDRGQVAAGGIHLGNCDCVQFERTTRLFLDCFSTVSEDMT